MIMVLAILELLQLAAEFAFGAADFTRFHSSLAQILLN